MGKKALVVSGGGSKGSFAVGVIKQLFEKTPDLNFDIICGTSTGALMAPLVAAGEIKLLEHIYTSVADEDVLNRGGLIERIMKANSLFDASPLKKLVERDVTQERYDVIQRSGRQLFLATVCLQTGNIVYFSNKTMQPKGDYEVIQIANLTELQRAMLASANQPVLMQPIEVRPNQAVPRQYVDGGVREYAPIRVAIHAGAEEIYAIMLCAEHSCEKKLKYDGVPEIMGRTIELLCEDVAANDVAIPELYSAGLRHLKGIRERLVKEGLPEAKADEIVYANENPFSNKREVSIYKFRPRQPLECDPLVFTREEMKKMVAQGYETATALSDQFWGRA